MKEMKAVFIIVNVGFANEAVELAQQCGAKGATIISARGSGAKFTAFLGMHYEPEREIILSVVSGEVADKIVEGVKEKLGRDSQAKGVCFIMPVEQTTTTA